MKNIIETSKKVISYTLGSILTTSILALLFSMLKGTDKLSTVFNANYIIATIIIGVGIMGFFIPISPFSLKKLKKSNPLIDHSNIIDVIREEKDIKISESIVNISWGICHIILVGIWEIVVKSFI